MVPERLRAAKRLAVGVKQTLKAVQAGAATIVYIASDAEERVVRPLRAEVARSGCEVVEVESMQSLGRMCGIDVGAAAAAILEGDLSRLKRA